MYYIWHMMRWHILPERWKMIHAGRLKHSLTLSKYMIIQKEVDVTFFLLILRKFLGKNCHKFDLSKFPAGA